MAAPVRRGPMGHPGLAAGSQPVLPERLQRKLNERHGVARDDMSGAGSMAQRMAMRRQQRSAERQAGLGGAGIEAMGIQDSRQGPPAWHGIGLRDQTVDAQRVWQEQMMQQRQHQMENSMQREQRIMEEQMLAREKRKVEQHKNRVEARRSAIARNESSAQALGVQSHLKVGHVRVT